MVAVRPTMTESTALGAAIAAGNAEGVGVWKLDCLDRNTITADTFTPMVSDAGILMSIKELSPQK